MGDRMGGGGNGAAGAQPEGALHPPPQFLTNALWYSWLTIGVAG
jgi:hypothetical protein